MPEKKPGRPRGAKYPTKKLVRMDEQTAADLQELAALYGCPEAEAVRRAIHDTLRCERRQLVRLSPPPARPSEGENDAPPQ